MGLQPTLLAVHQGTIFIIARRCSGSNNQIFSNIYPQVSRTPGRVGKVSGTPDRVGKVSRTPDRVGSY